MSYLPRSERRIEVLEAVNRIASVDGFDYATVRRISSELDMSAGNIHHLFGSAAALKREAFRHFAAQQLAGMEEASKNAAPRDQLHIFLYAIALGDDQVSHRLWAFGAQEASKDKEFALVWGQETDMWFDRVSEILLQLVDGKAEREAADKAALRLLCFAVGIRSLAMTSQPDVNAESVTANLQIVVENEIDRLKAGGQAALSSSSQSHL